MEKERKKGRKKRLREEQRLLIRFIISYPSQVKSRAAAAAEVEKSEGKQVFNFTNILRAVFSYKCVLRIFYVLIVCVCNFLAKENWQKSSS